MLQLRRSSRAALLALLAAPLLVAACVDESEEQLGATTSAFIVDGNGGSGSSGGSSGSGSGGTKPKDAGHDATPVLLHFDGSIATGPKTIVVDAGPDTQPPAPPPAPASVDAGFGCGEPLRVDVRRVGTVCADIAPPSAIEDGAWQITYPFAGDLPPELSDRFCTYTWVPSTAACAPPVVADLQIGHDDIATYPHSCDGFESCDVGVGVASPSHIDFKGGGGCPSCAVVLDSIAYVVIPNRQSEGVVVTVKSGGELIQYEVTHPVGHVFELELPRAPNGEYDQTASEDWL